MKARLITAFFGISLLLVILCLFQTPAINIALSVVLALAAHEAANSVGYGKKRVLVLAGVVYALLVPYATTWVGMPAVWALTIFYIAVIFVECIRKFPGLYAADVAMLAVLTVGTVLSLNCLVLIRDNAPSMAIGLYYLVLIFSSSWVCDGGAYFVGRACGKRKLAPLVSPKKTVEGFYGGLASAVVVNLLLTLLLAFLHSRKLLARYSPVDFGINYAGVALASIVLALLGVLGDLSTSTIKRCYKIKDFGTVFPGHGGILDRFDSLLFITPLVYFIMRYLPLLSVA